MGTVRLVAVGTVAPSLITAVAATIRGVLPVEILFEPLPLDPRPAFADSRDQYHATQLLTALETLAQGTASRVLGIAEVDLFIPILTFVFGEALLSRPAAVISTRRLDPGYYGLPPDADLLRRRAGVEAVHELGHTYGLIHCADYECVMHASRAAEEIDLKGPGFCERCRPLIRDWAG